MVQRAIKVYSDYKSPYAYLAKDLVYELERETGARIEWLPYTLDIPAYLGSASVDAGGKVWRRTERAPWRRVKYSYMDCRREANRRGLTIRGPRKIFDSALANIGMLFAISRASFAPITIAFSSCFGGASWTWRMPRPWRRFCSIAVLPAPSAELPAPSAELPREFVDFLDGQGRRALAEIRSQAEAAGVFGVPSFLFADGDLYWGREHLPRVRERLGAGRCSPCTANRRPRQ